jgi:hypothetical protein
MKDVKIKSYNRLIERKLEGLPKVIKLGDKLYIVDYGGVQYYELLERASRGSLTKELQEIDGVMDDGYGGTTSKWTPSGEIKRLLDNGEIIVGGKK